MTKCMNYTSKLEKLNNSAFKEKKLVSVSDRGSVKKLARVSVRSVTDSYESLKRLGNAMHMKSCEIRAGFSHAAITAERRKKSIFESWKQINSFSERGPIPITQNMCAIKSCCRSWPLRGRDLHAKELLRFGNVFCRCWRPFFQLRHSKEENFLPHFHLNTNISHQDCFAFQFKNANWHLFKFLVESKRRGIPRFAALFLGVPDFNEGSVLQGSDLQRPSGHPSRSQFCKARLIRCPCNETRSAKTRNGPIREPGLSNGSSGTRCELKRPRVSAHIQMTKHWIFQRMTNKAASANGGFYPGVRLPQINFNYILLKND